MNTPIALVAVGGSLGGVDALVEILGGLGPDWFAPEFPLDRSGLEPRSSPYSPPIAVVIHRGTGVVFPLAAHIARLTGCPVHEVLDGAPTRQGAVYVAPPDYHLLVDRHHLSLSLDDLQTHARPSIDALFCSAADAHGAGVVGVLLTGASEDGEQGLEAIRAAGGVAIVQSPESSRSPIAPQAAVDRGAADHVVPLDGIAPLLRQLVVVRRTGR